jgi:hypothetical protein
MSSQESNENKMSDGHRWREWTEANVSEPLEG